MNSASARASSVFPTPVGPRKMNEPIGRFGSCSPARARRSAFATASTACVLADDAPVQPLLHVDELLDLALEQARHRDAGPGGDDRGDVVLVDLLLHHRLLRCSSLALARAPARARADRRTGSRRRARSRPARSARSASMRSSSSCRLISRDALQRLLLADQRAASSSRTACASASSRSTRLARSSSVSFASAASSISSWRTRRSASSSSTGERVDLHPQARRRLVDEVDRLVGKEAVGDVAVGEHRRRDERGVPDLDAVVRLVALLQAAQDRDRVRDRRLPDEDGLEAPLERRVLLDVLAVLVERRRADGAQLAAGELRLQQVRGVDGALRRARADDRVQLVDEEDDLAGRVLDLVRGRPSAAPRTRRGTSRRRGARRRRAPTRACPSGPRGRRPRRCAARAPRRSRSCRRRARR